MIEYELDNNICETCGKPAKCGIISPEHNILAIDTTQIYYCCMDHYLDVYRKHTTR